MLRHSLASTIQSPRSGEFDEPVIHSQAKAYRTGSFRDSGSGLVTAELDLVRGSRLECVRLELVRSSRLEWAHSGSLE